MLGEAPSNKRASFTLIELLITMALVVLVVTFTVPRTTFFTRFLVHAEINKVYAIFSYLQQRAMASNEVQELTFDVAANTYSFKTVQGAITTQRLPGRVRFGILEGVKGPPSNPIRPIDKPVTFPVREGLPRVDFMTNGKVTPGTVYLVDQGCRCLGALTCPISQVSYIRRYSYNGYLWNLW